MILERLENLPTGRFHYNAFMSLNCKLASEDEKG